MYIRYINQFQGHFRNALPFLYQCEFKQFWIGSSKSKRLALARARDCPGLVLNSLMPLWSEFF